ncbi:MAG: hypothetical protein JWL84_1795 [Rhodospirillales bacterium]|nr:hypothetical protein [Rhodospirillales bacterium]
MECGERIPSFTSQKRLIISIGRAPLPQMTSGPVFASTCSLGQFVFARNAIEAVDIMLRTRTAGHEQIQHRYSSACTMAQANIDRSVSLPKRFFGRCKCSAAYRVNFAARELAVPERVDRAID